METKQHKDKMNVSETEMLIDSFSIAYSLRPSDFFYDGHNAKITKEEFTGMLQGDCTT